jgi:threonine/homoserine/homoserine lactone efflux protein
VTTTAIIVLVALAVGIISAILPLGPVTVLALRRALAGDGRGALWIGFGRVPAEVFYCLLATFGVVALLDRFPSVRVGAELFGTLVFLAVGLWLLVQRATPSGQSSEPPTPAELRARRWGDASGFIISILNPTFLFSWSAGVAIGVSMAELEPTLLDKIAFPIALGVGIAIGYVILVGVLRRWGERVEHAWVQRLIRTMGALFVALSLWSAASLLGLM